MIQQLKELIGRRFAYKDKEILIKNIKRVSGVYVVLTDKKTYNFFESEVPFFLKEIIELPKVKIKENKLEKTKMELETKPTQKAEVIIADNSDFKINDVLTETIIRLRVDKNYIAQANAICNVVTQMINLQKLEIQIKKNKQNGK